MADGLVYTVGDTAPALSGTVPADLTGASVSVRIRKPSGATLVGAGTVTEATATSSKWAREWTAGEIDEQGTWLVQSRVTYSNGKIQTFGPDDFRVQAATA